MSYENSTNPRQNEAGPGVLKPTWSFMALHCKNVSLTSHPKQIDEIHKNLAYGRQPRFERLGMKRNSKDAKNISISQSSEHILNFAHLTADEVYETKSVRVGHTSSSPEPPSPSHRSKKDNISNTASLISSPEQPKVNHDPRNSDAMSESPVENHLDDRRVSSDFSIIPISSEDLDNKMDTIETVFTARLGDESSSENFNGRRWQYRQSRNATASNDQTDQNGMHSLVLEAMKTIQRYELENEKQRQEMTRLNAVISDLQAEKQLLADKIAILKTTITQRAVTSSQALKKQEEELHALKLNSKELFATTDESKALLQEIRQFQDTISESVQSVQEYLNPEKCSQGNEPTFPSGLATREVISALKTEVQNKQQVSDMLRDRLTDALSDVAALRAHNFQIQEAYSAECLALRMASEARNTQDIRISGLLAELNNQRTESLKALTQAAELETKLTRQQEQQLELQNLHKASQAEADLRRQAEERVIRQDAIIQTQKTSLKSLEKITNEYLQLSSELASQTERLKSLDASQAMVKTLSDENGSLKNEAILRELAIREHEVKLASLERVSAKSEIEIEEQKSTIRDLRDAVSSNDMSISDLKHSVLNYQEKLTQTECLLEQTQNELSAFSQKTAILTESERALQAQCLEVTKEKETLILQLKGTSEKLGQVLASKEREIKTEINNQSKSFQEQFEDQNTTLRLVREANADLQERLLSVVADHTKTLEENRGSFRRDIAVLEERNTSLHTQLGREKECVTQLQARLSQKELDIQNYNQGSKERYESLYLRLHQDLQTVQEQKNSLEAQLHQEQATYQIRHSELQIKEAKHLREIDELHTDLDLRTQYEFEMKERHAREQSDNQKQIDLLQTRLSDLEKKNNNLPYNCFEHEQEIHHLRAHVHQIQAENEMIRNRMITLSLRYDSGDLDVTERNLVQKIMKGIQTVHDQEMAKLKNELHRKDGLITNLEDIKIALENSLRKKIQSPVTGKNAFETSEFINWPTSPLTASLPPQQITTLPVEPQDVIVGYRQPGSKHTSSPLSMAPITMLQPSNDNLELAQADTASTASCPMGLETQRLPKKPKTGGRNAQTYSSKNKRKRR